MINAYKENKDLYAMIGSKINKNRYEDNLEYQTDENGKAILDEKGEKILFPEGKKRRSKVKSLMLGITYSMGPKSLAESINGTVEDAQNIINDFYDRFPKVRDWIEKTNKDAKVNGYVEDLWGRKRRLPDLLLKKFEVNPQKSTTTFNPLLRSSGIFNTSAMKEMEEFEHRLSKCTYKKDIEKIKQEALSKGYVVKDNGGFIAQAERQCVNARIQGSAATMSKIALIKVFNDEELRNLGFKVMLQIHDELIGECPKENQKKVADRLTEVMRNCVSDFVTVPFKCDATIEKNWYWEDYVGLILTEYKEALESNTKNESLRIVRDNHIELSDEQFNEILVDIA